VADYRGDAGRAWSMLESQWPEIAGSPLRHVQMIRLECLTIRARTAVSAAAAVRGTPEAARLLDVARRNAKRVEREGAKWSTALATLVRGGIAAVEGDAARAVPLLEAAEAELLACHMRLYHAAARRLRGALVGGAAGQHLVDAADAVMAAERIVRPDRFAALLAPGAS